MLVILVIIGGTSYWSTTQLIDNSKEVTHTHEVLADLEELLSVMKDAETGQRGYLLTGDDRYLIPYDTALKEVEQRLTAVRDHEQADGGAL